MMIKNIQNELKLNLSHKYAFYIWTENMARVSSSQLPCEPLTYGSKK